MKEVGKLIDSLHLCEPQLLENSRANLEFSSDFGVNGEQSADVIRATAKTGLPNAHRNN